MYEHPVVSFHPSPPPFPRNYTPVNEGYISVVDPGEGLGGPHPSYIRPNWGPESRKFFLRPPPPFHLRVGMTGPLPFLKVWICHCSYQYSADINTMNFTFLSTKLQKK